MGWLRKAQKTTMLAAGILLAASFAFVEPAAAASCTWGGTPTVVPPSATALRAYGEPHHAPGRVAIDAGGHVYTTDPGAGRIIVRDEYGRLSDVMEGFYTPTGIAVDASGNIYVGEKGRGSVAVFDAKWNFLHTLGAGDDEFVFPNGIAIDTTTGRSYVVDTGVPAVKVYSSTGAAQFMFDGFGTGDGQFNFPADVYVSPMGEVFVTDEINDRVHVFDRNGSFLRCFGSSGSFVFRRKFGGLLGVTGDSLGRIYVADTFQGHIKVFDRFGVLLTTLGSFGTGPGQLRTPIDLAIDPFNRLFVSSVNNSRVEVFGLDNFDDPHRKEKKKEEK